MWQQPGVVTKVPRNVAFTPPVIDPSTYVGFQVPRKGAIEIDEQARGHVGTGDTALAPPSASDHRCAHRHREWPIRADGEFSTSPQAVGILQADEILSGAGPIIRRDDRRSRCPQRAACASRTLSRVITHPTLP
jgi:hypothetical protein